MTKQLTENIKRQIVEYNVDREEEKQIQQAIKKERKNQQENLLKEIRKSLTKEELRANDIAQMKGSSAWLNALPLESEDYSLTKRVFFDAVNDRYRWELKRLPVKCVCGQKFTTEHAMQCTNGGFMHKMLNEVAYDVRIEPPLEPLTESLLSTANVAEEARLDIAARGFWEEGVMAFFDVRVFNPFAKTHLKSKLSSAFERNETEKKTAYNQRVIEVEHGSFTPVVLSAYGGFGQETERFLSKLILKIAVLLRIMSEPSYPSFSCVPEDCASGEAENHGGHPKWTYQRRRLCMLWE